MATTAAGTPYVESSDLVANYPGVSLALANHIDTVGGLVNVEPTSIANSGGSASISANTVNFSSVTQLSLNGCFTSAYKNYLFIMQLGASGGTDLDLRLRAGGTDASGANYDSQRGVFSGVSVSASTPLNQTSIRIGTFFTGNDGISSYQIMRPQLAQATIFNGNGGSAQSNQVIIGDHDISSAYDGFTLIPNGGFNITGTIQVFGYKD